MREQNEVENRLGEARLHERRAEVEAARTSIPQVLAEYEAERAGVIEDIHSASLRLGRMDALRREATELTNVLVEAGATGALAELRHAMRPLDPYAGPWIDNKEFLLAELNDSNTPRVKPTKLR